MRSRPVESIPRAGDTSFFSSRRTQDTTSLVIWIRPARWHGSGLQAMDSVHSESSLHSSYSIYLRLFGFHYGWDGLTTASFCRPGASLPLGPRLIYSILCHFGITSFMSYRPS
jgi:hypothetical protein